MAKLSALVLKLQHKKLKLVKRFKWMLFRQLTDAECHGNCMSCEWFATCVWDCYTGFMDELADEISRKGGYDV